MKKQQGFTLIEIAIVLVIIGLLTGGVLKGQELIQSAKVSKTISMMDELKTSVFGFQDRYKALPGDMRYAQRLLGKNAANCSSNCDDGLIQPWKNTSIVTNNLAAAGFYSGPYNSKEVDKKPNPKNAPTNPWGGAMFVAYWNGFIDNGKLWKRRQNGIYTGGAIASKVLAEIDRKIDDGNPGKGSFRAAWPRSGGTCQKKGQWVIDNGDTNCAGVSLY